MNLRPLETKDLEGIYDWMKDSDINCFFRFDPYGVTKESIFSFIQNSMTDENRHYAFVNEVDEYLGTISLKNISITDRNAEFAISTIKKAMGTGAAALATNEIFNIAFNELNLNKIYLNVYSDNFRAIKFYEKMGFEYEGEFKEHIFVNGQYRDLKWYGIRRNLYEKFRG